MSDLNSDSSPTASSPEGLGGDSKLDSKLDMRSVFAELNRLRETLEEKDKEINRLQRETHKLKVRLPIVEILLIYFPLNNRFIIIRVSSVSNREIRVEKNSIGSTLGWIM